MGGLGIRGPQESNCTRPLRDLRGVPPEALWTTRQDTREGQKNSTRRAHILWLQVNCIFIRVLFHRVTPTSALVHCESAVALRSLRNHLLKTLHMTFLLS